MATKFNVITLENISGVCGWEINNAYTTGVVIEVEDTSLKTIMKALKAAGQMSSGWRSNQLYLWDGENSNSIYIRRRTGGEDVGKWMYELQDAEAMAKQQSALQALASVQA